VKIKNKVDLRKAWAESRSAQYGQVGSGERAMAGEITFAGMKDLVPFKYGKELTNSARSTFLSCPQKYEYSYVYGIAPRRTQIPFLVGGLFHDELERMYKTGELNPEAMRKRVGDACEKACQFPGASADDSDLIWMQQAIVCGMVKGYKALYLEKDLERYEVVEAEGQFEAKLPRGWKYRGKKDLVLRERKTKQLILCEHKTAGKIDAGYVAKLPMDNQILGYAWAQRESGGEEFASVLYNVTKKPQIRQTQKESSIQFQKRIEDDYILNPGAYFYRERLTFTTEDLDRFGAQLKKFVNNIERAREEDDFFQNAGECVGKFGTCPFMRLCLGGINKDTLLGYRIKKSAHEELPEASQE
jgi:hypothetical protein